MHLVAVVTAGGNALACATFSLFSATVVCRPTTAKQQRKPSPYGGISWTDQDITQIWYPASGYHRKKGVVIGAYIWSREPTLRYAGLTGEERLKQAMAEGEQLHPGYEAEMECGVSRVWGNVPLQKGAWAKEEEKVKKAATVLREPDGPFYFAGSQVTALAAWQEGAVLSAHAALNRMHRSVAR